MKLQKKYLILQSDPLVPAHLAPPMVLTPTKDLCVNCEDHKWIKAKATLNNRVGYICEECYNTHIWANTRSDSKDQSNEEY